MSSRPWWAGDDSGPDHHLDRERLRQAIRRLPSGYRTPLTMQALLGCSGREIAETLGLGESAVMTRLFRARKKLMADFAITSPAAPEDNCACDNA